MAYTPITAYSRDMALGYNRVNQIIGNNQHNQGAFLAEHTEDGAHNALRIPRILGRFEYNGVLYNYLGSEGVVTTSLVPTLGRAEIELDAAFNEGSAMVPIIQCAAEAAGGPVIQNVRFAPGSITDLEVYSWRGPAWTLEHNSFFLKAHCEPVLTTPNLFVTEKLRRKRGLDPTTWNDLAENQQTLYAGVSVAHTAAGAHNARPFPRCVGLMTWNGAAASVAAQHGTVTSVTRIGAGVYDIVLPAATYWNANGADTTGQAQIFIAVQTTAGTEDWITTVPLSTLVDTGNYLTKFRVHLWKRSLVNTWTATDKSFWFTIHARAA